MKKSKKAFTLVEAVTTIAIMGVAFALTAICVSNMVKIENGASKQVAINNELAKANDSVNEYVSFVSVNTDDLSFSYKQSTESSVTFTDGTSDYTLSSSQEHKNLVFSSTYSGDNPYLSKTFSYSFKYISHITFSFDSSISLLVGRFFVEERTVPYTYSYVLETLL